MMCPKIEIFIHSFSRKMGNIIRHSWKKDGVYHRCDEYGNDVDLPAVVRWNGTREWYVNGKLHRDGDLPALERADGGKVWYVNGNCHRDGDLPAIEHAYGHKAWYKNGELHRDGGLPAIHCVSGTKEWYINGKRHRDDDLPAVEFASGTKQWWIHGTQIQRDAAQQIQRTFRTNVLPHLLAVLPEMECSVCLEPMKKTDSVVMTQCNHFYHSVCIDKCREHACPLCNK